MSTKDETPFKTLQAMFICLTIIIVSIVFAVGHYSIKAKEIKHGCEIIKAKPLKPSDKF